MKTVFSLLALIGFVVLFANSRRSFGDRPKVEFNSPASPEIPAIDDSITKIDSLPSELLPVPIMLDHCPGVKVIEWRSSVGYESTTGPSKKAVGVVNQTCAMALGGFNKFLVWRRLKTATTAVSTNFRQYICLMPSRTDRGGNKVRNLNDIQFRFSTRYKTYTNDGRLYTILGYTHYANNTIYIGNDVLNDDGSVNKKFVTVLAHELFHAMSWYHEITKPIDEEQTAKDFTEFLGMGR